MLWVASSKASAAVSLVTESVVVSTVSKDCCVTRLTADSIATDSTDRAKKRKPFYEKGLLGKAVNYLRNSNKTAQDSKRDFGFIPGPHYSSTTGLGLGLLGTLTYSPCAKDSLTPRSNASIYSDMTTGGFFLVGLKGTHFTKRGKTRTDYKVNVSTFKNSFWGIGYEAGKRDENETEFRRNKFNALLRFQWQPLKYVYVGPIVQYRWIQATEAEEKFYALNGGQPHIVRAMTFGLSMTYDSRDFMLNATKGSFLQIDQSFTPRGLTGKNYGFSTTEFTFSTYKKIWKGGVLAYDLHSMFNCGHTPWALLSEVGGNDRMRGYYEGRYRDQHLVETQLELRQHIKGRNGAVAWVGLAEPFRSWKEFQWSHFLPNAGVGYRWEFKPRINLRLDVGFTKGGGAGFIFNLNEAF